MILINFPTSKVRILDLLSFDRVSSLFSASFFFASKLLRMSFAVSLLSSRTLRNFFACLSQFRYCLLSASFFFASKLLRMSFAVSLLSPRTLPNYFPAPFVPPNSLLPFAPLASPLAPPPPSHSLAHAREGYSLADPPSLLGSSRLVKYGDGHNPS